MRAFALVRPLAPFLCLYVTFGTTLGFLAGGAPLILRARGVELAEIGLLQLINLPVGLTFLWAAAVDGLRVPGLPHRTGWIVAMQATAVALLAVLSGGETWPLLVLFGLAVATSFCVATMDVALEALVVETVSDDLRPLVASAKFCGAALGSIVGSGLLIGFYDVLGWRAAILTVAGIDALCLLPILRYPEARLRRPDARMARDAATLGRLRLLGGRVLVLGLYFAALSVLSGFNNLALLDLGLPLAEVGFVTGGLSAGINLVMAALSGSLVRRFGTVPLVTLSAAGMVAAGGLMGAAALAGAPRLALAATVLGFVCGGGLGVPVFGMIYRWAQGPRPATDYALLFGAAFFAAMPVRVGAPALAGAAGWPVYYALAVSFFAAAFLVLRSAIARTLAADRAGRAP
ncbi:Anhydromuropeptide permease [Methylobacterium crusticola]|uniref:Anhydromuropeptide permease n=2 Tax=Methylobacterium crusticola TaxID=1697972 RepID=A0ABQ4QY04_9HYPH|nr:MFS transporter [Methylobacterium crusticola]GJD49600.1 Anhydromuropeptide permease [Methylobacterium crusticola]